MTWRPRTACLAGVAALLAAGWTQDAEAHAYLVRSAPAVGGVVAKPPPRVVLVFSEPVSPLAGADVVGPRGASALGGKPYVPPGRASTIVFPLAKGLGGGSYTVHWREVDEADGHQLGGSFDFAVGRHAAAPAGGIRASSGFSARTAAVRWLLLISILLAGGFVAFRRLVLIPVVSEAELGRREPRAASTYLAFALAGVACAAGVLVAMAPGALSTGYAQRMLAGGAVAAAGALVALAARGRPRALVLAEVAAVASLALPSVTGHAIRGAQRQALSIPGDILHVVAAATWVGGIASLAIVAPLVVRPLDPAATRAALAAMARRFAPLAIGAVALLGVTGLIRAVGELGALSELWATGYGRALIAKTALLAVALVFVALNREGVTGASVDRAIKPELALLFVLVGVVAVLTGLTPGRTGATAEAVAGPVRGSAIVMAGHTGGLAVGLSIAPVDRQSVGVRATVIGPQGPRSDTTVSFLAGGRRYRGRPCGRGCYRAAVPLSRGRPAVAVALSVPRHRQRIVRFDGPEQWPAPTAAGILRRAKSAWRRLRTLNAVTRIASDPQHAVTTVWRFRAPDRLSYRNMPGGAQAIVIGRRRWDRASARATWRESSQDAVRQPVPPWSSAASSPHLLGTATMHGRPVWRVSFLDRSTPAWFTVFVDTATYRTLRVDMVAQAHFMRQANRGFNQSTPIEAPRK
jgi:copper transport protein